MGSVFINQMMMAEAFIDVQQGVAKESGNPPANCHVSAFHNA